MRFQRIEAVREVLHFGTPVHLAIHVRDSLHIGDGSVAGLAILLVSVGQIVLFQHFAEFLSAVRGAVFVEPRGHQGVEDAAQRLRLGARRPAAEFGKRCCFGMLMLMCFGMLMLAGLEI